MSEEPKVVFATLAPEGAVTANSTLLEVLDHEARFIELFNHFQNEVHQTAIEKGWWAGGADRNKGEMIALMHSELSEALEALRHGNPPDNKCPEFDGVSVELADVLIRMMDFAQAFGYDIVEATMAKMAMNRTRAHKHGGKAF